MTNFKDIVITELKAAGADMDNIKLRHFKKSPWQKNRLKPEYVGAEVWLYINGRKWGDLILETDYNKQPDNDRAFTFNVIAAESKQDHWQNTHNNH